MSEELKMEAQELAKKDPNSIDNPPPKHLVHVSVLSHMYRQDKDPTHARLFKV